MQEADVAQNALQTGRCMRVSIWRLGPVQIHAEWNGKIAAGFGMVIRGSISFEYCPDCQQP